MLAWSTPTQVCPCRAHPPFLLLHRGTAARTQLGVHSHICTPQGCIPSPALQILRWICPGKPDMDLILCGMSAWAIYRKILLNGEGCTVWLQAGQVKGNNGLFCVTCVTIQPCWCETISHYYQKMWNAIEMFNTIKINYRGAAAQAIHQSVGWECLFNNQNKLE